MRLLRRIGLGASAALLLVVLPAAGQTATPNTVLVSPPLSRFLAEVELSWNRPSAFVTDKGNRNAFPGSLGFGLAVLRVSYAPFANFAAGLELPYRYYRYRADGFDHAATGSGSPGVGVFGDWRPSGSSAKLQFEARVEVFFGFDAHGELLSLGDGVNRYLFAVQVLSPPTGGLWEGWRADLGTRVELEYGPNSEPEDKYSEGNLLAHAGPRLGRLGKVEIFLLGVGGFRLASSARQEGNIFRTNRSTGLSAGGLLSLSFPGSAPRLPTAVELSVTRELARTNSLDGWRASLTLRRAY